MRPLKITMQAFGPYAAKEEIDFTKLGSRTMFVISGKTGAGKTTIFDGISYAIYGKASGEDRNGTDLRSQFASSDLLTEVELEFSLRNKIYLIRRSPQQEKKKDRGEGYTTIGAKAELYVADETGKFQILASNVRDVDVKIKEIMLIDSNQFRQILMIPQGEFRKLLTSDSKEKETILQRLFHTEIYKKVEDKLKEEALELKNAVESQKNERNQTLGRIQAFLHEELRTALLEDRHNDVKILPLLKEEIELLNSELTRLTNETQIKEAEKDKIQQQLFEGEAIMKQLQARKELKKRKLELEDQKQAVEGKENLITLAQKAAVLTNQEELCHRLKRELDGAKANQESILAKKEELTSSYTEWEIRLKQEKEKETERQDHLETVNRLKQMEEEVRSLSLFSQEVDRLDKQLQEVSFSKKSSEERIKAMEQAVQAIQAEKKQLDEEQMTYFENERKMDKLEHVYEQIVKCEQQYNRYLQAQRDCQHKAGLFESTHSRYEDSMVLVQELEQKWLHGQAAILANKLQNGEECPVCGSTNHPNLALNTKGDIPSEEDLKVAKQQRTEAEAEKRQAESSLIKAQAAEKTLEESVKELLKSIANERGEFSVNELDLVKNTVGDEILQLRVRQEQLQKQKKRLEIIGNQLEKYEQEIKQTNDYLASIIEKMNRLTIQFTEKNTVLSQMKDKIPQQLQTIPAFETELQRVVQQYEELMKRYEHVQLNYQRTNEMLLSETARFEEAEKQTAQAEQKLKVEREKFKLKLEEQGFIGYTAYEKAKKSEQEIMQLQQEVRFYHEEFRSVKDRYEELDKVLSDIKEPDLAELNAAFEMIKSEILAIQNRYNQLFVRKAEDEHIAEKVEMINDGIKSLEEKYELIGHLYEMAKGQNNQRITFERYVLAAFLDDILREANERLKKMTSGRYELNRKTDRSKGNVQSGLELLVFDQYTGQERHVKTLSGGESFKASLSLALGLADIVQQYAGGVSLETMFIDEGFGTLDPESLDQSIEALIDIQSSGRLVGIISHVPELKERIDARLEVMATKSGSTTEFHFLNG
ncbi:AAA family ATPase [Niallia endozanthoxylica]|uniref:Nuclease SbcCD subunit C n=1 Tax=Niallia endozanthoxylica TaxID=2036016 RepID=A0A5J5HTK4_9BACI|nr:AAA family ATPase [Niallia endozanthoxylica]KAA9025695.1 AAA family ATPase [Niallia endozanthoxylica]